MNWSKPERPVDYAEHALITAIVEGQFPPDSTLPGERDLADMLGVTRPTLREVLGRLERDGWITIRQGKSTVVNDFWWDGGLNVLSGIVRCSRILPPDFVPNLLRVRLDIAPSYTRLAVERAAESVVDLLSRAADLPDTPPAYAAFDWLLQRRLAVASGNPVYAMILNGFNGFYEPLAREYFSLAEARDTSRAFYAALLEAARAGDGDAAENVVRAVMLESINLWARSHLGSE
ncbi:MAG: fatty acid metabolism transcriptional regulator FadR [Chloroflexi bacterium]|nr:fatty acid metabolism transcriptional regulator FadR [Chloroflexota bacterium]